MFAKIEEVLGYSVEAPQNPKTPSQLLANMKSDNLKYWTRWILQRSHKSEDEISRNEEMGYAYNISSNCSSSYWIIKRKLFGTESTLRIKPFDISCSDHNSGKFQL